MLFVTDKRLFYIIYLLHIQFVTEGWRVVCSSHPLFDGYLYTTILKIFNRNFYTGLVQLTT